MRGPIWFTIIIFTVNLTCNHPDFTRYLGLCINALWVIFTLLTNFNTVANIRYRNILYIRWGLSHNLYLSIGSGVRIGLVMVFPPWTILSDKFKTKSKETIGNFTGSDALAPEVMSRAFPVTKRRGRVAGKQQQKYKIYPVKLRHFCKITTYFMARELAG